MTHAEILLLAKEIARELRAEERLHQEARFVASMSVDQIIAMQKEKMRQQDRERKKAKTRRAA